MVAGMLAHPVALLIGLVVVSVSNLMLYSLAPRATAIAPLRLAGGYAGAILACAAVSAAAIYVSPEDSRTVFHVPVEQYWNVLLREFLAVFVILCYATVVGIALVGAPVAFVLNARRRASVSWMVAASLAISALAATLFAMAFPSSISSFLTAAYVAGLHLVLTLGFCLGARIPWRADAPSA